MSETCSGIGSLPARVTAVLTPLPVSGVWQDGPPSLAHVARRVVYNSVGLDGKMEIPINRGSFTSGLTTRLVVTGDIVLGAGRDGVRGAAADVRGAPRARPRPVGPDHR